LELVPSLQVTVAAVEVLAGAAAAGGVLDAAGAGAVLLVLVEADLLMPPCPLQAPRPPCGDVVPSIQVTGVLLEVSCAKETTGAASSAATSIAPQTRPLEFVTFIAVLRGSDRLF
jgi:hypothetical protein